MKPVLVGSDNPHSTMPEMALAPWPEGKTGSRIYRMIASRSLVTPAEYMRAFDRRNFFDEGVTPKRFIRSTCPGSTIVLLGRSVADALCPTLKIHRDMFLSPQVSFGRTWRLIPHPSGMNRFYNDPVARELVSLLLSDLYEETYPWSTRHMN